MITVGEAIKLLQEAGFTELNQVGSHKKFGKGVYRFTIVYHRSPKEELHKPTQKKLNNLLKQVKDESANKQ